MTDLLIICKDGFKQSIIANLATSIALKQKELNVVLMFTQEAMIALVEKNFAYQGLLAGYAETIEKTIEDMGFSVDPLNLLNMARSMGVKVITCPIWARVAESKSEISSEIEIVDINELFELLSKAKKIMGSF